MHRRSFLRAAAATGLAAGFAPAFLHAAAAAPAVPGAGPYGPLQAPDVNGFRLPAGFSSRVVARTNQIPVAGSTYSWHRSPDGGACCPAPDGGWVYVSNAEVGSGGGGVGALRFSAAGDVTSAYPILVGTSGNCAGGSTPWGTWLSCEESGSAGQVYECDPFTARTAADRPDQRRAALGAFNHEAVAVDPPRQQLYLTEDSGSGRFYRFTPTAYPDLSAGVLEAALRTPTGPFTGTLSWVPVPATAPYRGADTSSFNGGEGIWYDEGFVFFTTKGDNRVWAVNCATQEYEVLYDRATSPASSVLSGVDNIFVSPFSGDIYVAEDGGSMDVVILAAPNLAGVREITQFLTLTGQSGSEITGPAMSPDGTRMYLSSQRGTTGTATGGITYEITGPFRDTRTPAPVVPESPLGPAALIGGAVLAAGAAAAYRSTRPDAPVPG